MGGWSEEESRRGSVEQQQKGEAAVSASQAKTLALFTASALISPEQVCVHGGMCVHRGVCVCVYTEECVCTDECVWASRHLSDWFYSTLQLHLCGWILCVCPNY